MKAGRRAVFNGDLYVRVKISVILGTNLEYFIKQKELRQLRTRCFMLEQKKAAHIVS